MVGAARYVAAFPYRGEDYSFFANNRVARILGMTVSPDDFVPERLSDQYSNDETTTFNLKENFESLWNFTGQSTDAVDLPVTDMGFFMFRSALRHTIMYTPCPAFPASKLGYWYDYQAVYDLANIDSTGRYKYCPLNSETCLTDTVCWTPLGTSTPSWAAGNPDAHSDFTKLTFWTPHGNYAYSGFSQQDAFKSGVFLDIPASTPHANIVVSWLGEGTVNSGSFLRVNLYYWDGGDFNFFTEQTVSGTSLQSDGATVIKIDSTTLGDLFQGTGVYAAVVSLVGTSDDDTNGIYFTCEIYTESQSSWAHQPLNQLSPYKAMGNQITGVRFLGQSLLMKNTSAVLYQSGAVVALQAKQNTDWLHTYVLGQGTDVGGMVGTASQSFYNYVFNQSNEKDFRLANGLYGFYKPTQASDYGYIEEIALGNGNFPCAMQYDLSTPHDYLVVAASVQAVGGGDVYLKFADAGEYKTLDMWLPKEQPDTSTTEWDHMREELKYMPQWYENPTHRESLLFQIMSYNKGKRHASHRGGGGGGKRASYVGGASSYGFQQDIGAADELADVTANQRKKAIQAKIASDTYRNEFGVVKSYYHHHNKKHHLVKRHH